MPKNIEGKGDANPHNDLGSFLTDLEDINENRLPDILHNVVDEEGDSFKDSQRLTGRLEAATSRHADFLERCGLRLDLRKSHGKLFKNEEDTPEEGKVSHPVINIEDPEKFVSFLNTYRAEQLNATEIEDLTNLAKIFWHQLTDYYKLQEVDDDFLRFATVLKDMAQKYKELSEATKDEGLVSYAKSLDGASKAMSGKYLKEYLDMYELELLDVSIDIDDDKYDRTNILYKYGSDYCHSWSDEVIDTFNNGAKNKNAHEFLTHAIEYIESRLPSNGKALDGASVPEEEMAIIDNLRKKLDKIKSRMDGGERS